MSYSMQTACLALVPLHNICWNLTNAFHLQSYLKEFACPCSARTYTHTHTRISEGDVGTVTGPCSDETRADKENRVEVDFGKRKGRANFIAKLELEYAPLASGYQKGDRVKSLVDFNRISKGDIGTVVGPCDVESLADKADRVLVDFGADKGKGNFHAKLELTLQGESRLWGFVMGIVLGVMGLVQSWVSIAKQEWDRVESQSRVPVWLRGAMQEDEMRDFGAGIRKQRQFEEKHLEFFTDDLLKETGVTNAITRVRMLRRISEHFNRPRVPEWLREVMQEHEVLDFGGRIGQVCVECLFLRTPSRAPYRTPPACAKRATYSKCVECLSHSFRKIDHKLVTYCGLRPIRNVCLILCQILCLVCACCA
jgi:hypothetical protein